MPSNNLFACANCNALCDNIDGLEDRIRDLEAEVERLTCLHDKTFRSMAYWRDKCEAAEDQQIEHMVSRFLSWELPLDFEPDAGISFDGSGRPSGTNLFTATQAEEMVRHMLKADPPETES